MSNIINPASASFSALPAVSGLRLSLATLTPVMAATVAGATTVYATPYIGSKVPIYDGTNFSMQEFGEVNQATTDTTKSPAAVAASSAYDIFAWMDGATPRATRGPVWTSLTARSAGTALVRQNGILLNSLSITNGPAASRGTYIGSIASNGASQIDYIFGGSASGGTAAALMVWNMYNRRPAAAASYDNGANYTYNNATIRQARASAGNQIAFMNGLQEDAVDVTTWADISVNVGGVPTIGIGVNALNAYFNTTTFAVNTAAAVANFQPNLAVKHIPAIGVNTYSRNESVAGASAANMNFSSNASLLGIFQT